MSKQAEIDYLSKIGKEGVEHLYRKPFTDPLNTYRNLREIANIIRIINLPRDSKVLDLGVGSGWTSLFLSRCGYRVTGVDISLDMISISKERAAKENLDINFLVMDMEESVFYNEFDAAVIYDALHHCGDEEKVIESCFRALKEGGKILIYEPSWMHNISPQARATSMKFGVTEKGYSAVYLIRLLKKKGFYRARRFFEGYDVYGGNFLDFLKAMIQFLMRRFFFWPQTKILIVASK